MGELGRKLTIRMPDNPNLREAGVGAIHVDPGGKVAKGSPVLSLVSRRASHIVRAPRSGKILPLVAVEDRVIAGDPLFVLHLDEEALADANRDSRALVPVAKARWNAGVRPEEINPVARERETTPRANFKFSPEGPWGTLLGSWDRLVDTWGRVALALALYSVACLVVLPLLHLFSPEAPAWLLGVMVGGAGLIAALIWYLHASGGGVPRFVVRTVAASWIVLAGLAIFLRPDIEDGLTLAGLRDTVSKVFASDPAPTIAEGDPVLAPEDAPDQGPGPVVRTAQQGPLRLPPVAASGVASDSLGAPILPPGEPNSTLAALQTMPLPHGVEVRTWGRVYPGRGSAKPPMVVLAAGERRPPPPALAPVALAAPDVTLSGSEALDASVLVRVASLFARGDGAGPQIAVLLGEIRDSGAGEKAHGIAVRPGTMPTMAGALVELAIGPGPGNAPETPQPSGKWLTKGNIPVIADSGWKDVVANEDRRAAALAALSSPPARGTPGGRPGSTREIDPVRRASRLAGAGRWLKAQTAALSAIAGGTPDTDAPSTPALSRQSSSFPATPERSARPLVPVLLDREVDPVRVASRLPAGEKWLNVQTVSLSTTSPAFPNLGPLAAPSIPRRATEHPLVPERSTRPRVPLLLDLELDMVERGGLPQAPTPSDSDATASWGAVDQAPARPRRVKSAPLRSELVAVAAQPRIPSAAAAPAVREMLYLYVNDPRRERQPGLGDPWIPMMPEGLRKRLVGTRIVEVIPLIQVSSWCPAAGGVTTGDGLREAWLDDRVRLIRVAMWTEPEDAVALEKAVPVFGDGPPGFFHNRLPLMGGMADSGLIARGLSFVRSMSNSFMDPNAPSAAGGQYYDDLLSLVRELRDHGCREVVLNGGARATSTLGKLAARALAR